MVPLPGNAMPRASHRQFIELAVNMPEQEPQVGQALCSSFFNSASVILPALQFADTLEHGDQVRLLGGGLEVRRKVRLRDGGFGDAGRHRPAADKNGRDVQRASRP